MKKCLLAFLSCLLAGCGQFVSVEGQVFQDGKPLDRAMVMFLPDGEPGLRSGQAMTDSKGDFAVKTSNQKGILPGRYKVTVSKVLFPPEYYTTDPDKDFAKLASLSAQGKEVVPPRYRSERDTPLRVDVPREGKKDVRIEIESP